MGEIVTRGNLPHWYVPRAADFVTYRLAGTLPPDVLAHLKRQREELLNRRKGEATEADHRTRVHKQLFAEYDRALDRSRSVRWLAKSAIAKVVRENLYHHHGGKYTLLAFCIMPNHVHVLLRPDEAEGDRETAESVTVGESDDGNSPLASIMHSLKSYTAHEANKILQRTGPFWQRESYDHWVRDDEELERIVNYIRGNPVSAGLVECHQDWQWSSCHDRFLADGDTSGWLLS